MKPVKTKSRSFPVRSTPRCGLRYSWASQGTYATLYEGNSMKVYSFWRCAGSAGVYLSAESGKDTRLNETVTVLYCGKSIPAPKEVADFLEQDRKREQAQDRRDARHLSRSEFETVLSGQGSVRRSVEDKVLQNLQAELVATVLGVSPSSGYELMHEPGFPVLKIGNRMVVPKEKFIQWVEQNTTGGKQT